MQLIVLGTVLIFLRIVIEYIRQYFYSSEKIKKLTQKSLHVGYLNLVF